jgi:hypothetical protein
MERRSVRGMVLVALVVGMASMIPGGVMARAGAGKEPARGNRVEATFTETRLVVTERPELGIRQVINSGVGTLEGFGDATEMVAVSIDRTVEPCGPGSDTTTVLRRIVVADGTLVLKTSAHRCPTSSGLIAYGEFEVDGASSTGVFAGAWGGGSDTVDIAMPVNNVTISGKLHLRQH